MRWVIRTASVLTVVCWIVIQGLFARPSAPDLLAPPHSVAAADEPAGLPADWARLIGAGVDAIITDDPAALIAYLKNLH